jgi:formylglycine-generating enzyme required for sulfatase activity
MKKCIYIALLCLTSWTIFAQEAEQIDLGPYGTLVVRTNKKPLEYFETQMKLWEKKVHQNKKDANAWLNYFAVTKYLNHVDLTKKWKELQSKPGSKIGKGVDMSKSEYQHETIAQEAYKNLPNSFEANYMMHFKDNFMIKRDYSYLLKAHEIKPYDTKILDALIRFYHLVNDTVNLKKTAIEIANSNLISTNEYNLAYNLLAELDDQAVLLVTYPELVECIVLQQTKNIKPKVIITTKNVIAPTNQNEYQYTDIALARMGISRRVQEIITSGNQKELQENYTKVERNYLQDVFNVNQPVYVSLNSINMFKDDFSNQLYLHGLTYRYSKQPANYIYNIKDNYEKNYSLDYIKHDILPNPTDNYDQSLYYMYYPSALKLYQFYQEKGMYLQQQEMKKFIQILAEKSGKDFIKKSDLFKENEIVTYSRAEIDFKKLQASFVALNATEHIGKFEVTNGEYNLFLKNLKQTKNFELYYKCMIDSLGWERQFVYSYHDPMTDMYGWHPAYSNYPVVNIPYEGAVAYCKWLTVQYNQQHPEGKYVSFRLPTEQEWRYAAGSKNEKAITPFPHDNIITKDPKSFGLKNTHISRLDGTEFSICYLGNIKTDSMRYQDDGGFHTVKSESYAPNPLGIYNTFGNVAEMTSTKGIIKGGSWADLFWECTFDKNATYSAPDPRVGFRIMMEVVPDIQDLPTTKIAPNLGVDKTEITHFYWLEFLEYQKDYYGENSREYRDNLPDSTLVKKGDCEHYNSEQYKHPAYRNMPMIGITQKQALKYTEWRTNRVFENYLESNAYITRIDNAPKSDFTVEKYYQNGLTDYTINTVEKFPYIPNFAIPSIEDYQQIKVLAIGNNNEKTKTKSLKMTFEIDSIALCNLNEINTFIDPKLKNIVYYLESGIAEWTSESDKVINGSIEQNELHKKGAVTDANQLKYIGFRNKVEWKKWEGKSLNGPFHFPSYNQKSIDSYKPLLKVKIAENFYCDQYELRIQEYANFILWNKQIFGENSNEYKIAIPDTTGWTQNELKLLRNIYKGITTLEQQFTFLKGVTENQLKAYNQWRSNYMFYSYLYMQAKIKHIDFLKETKDNYFTINRYFNGDFDSLLIGEKVNMYPEQRIPTEQEKTICQKYSDDLVSNGEFNFHEGKSIFSKKYLSEHYEFLCHETQMQPGKCAYLWRPKNKLFTPKTPFNIWENYRMIVEWKPWNPTKTN